MITQVNNERLAKLNANAAFRSVGPTHYEDERTGKVRVRMIPVIGQDGKPVMEEYEDEHGAKVMEEVKNAKGDVIDRKPALRVKKRVDTGYVECDIVDKTECPPGKGGHCVRYVSYATGRGDTEEKALENALDIAEKAIKPLTPAQRADIEAGRYIDPNAKRYIGELERELADLRKKIPTQNKNPNA